MKLWSILFAVLIGAYAVVGYQIIRHPEKDHLLCVYRGGCFTLKGTK